MRSIHSTKVGSTVGNLLLLLAWSVFFCVFALQAFGQSPAYGQDVLKYNIHENEWSYSDQSTVLRYNHYEGRWDYTWQDSRPRYNPYEGRFEWASPSKKWPPLRTNPVWRER